MTKLEKYVKILEIELGDLEEQIEELVSHYTVPDKQQGRTERVCQENRNVLRSEERGVDSLVKALESLDTSVYSDLDEMVDQLKVQFKKDIKAIGYPMAAFAFAEQRMNVVREYVKAG